MATKHSYSSARERAEKHTSGFDSTSLKLPEGLRLWKPKTAGVYKIDIIPFVAGKGNPFADEGALHYERTYYVHPRLGGEGDTYVCPSKTAGKPCPICELQKKLRSDGDADEKLVKSLWPRERQLFQIIDLADKEKGIQLWDVSYALFGSLLDEIMKGIDDTDAEDRAKARFYHLTKGSTLKITLTEKSMGGKNTFLEATVIEFKAREPYDEDILEKTYCLDKIPKVEDYDTLVAALEGATGKKKKPAADDDDEDEKPAPKKKPAPADDDEDDAPPAKKKPAPADDDEDDAPPAKKKPAPADDDEDDAPPAKKKKPADDDDEDDAPPAKKKPAPADDDDEAPAPKKKPAPADDDDWDDAPKKKPAPADDDEDDAPPAKKKPAPADDDDEAPAPKKKPAADDDDDWDAPPAKKKKPAADDED